MLSHVRQVSRWAIKTSYPFGAPTDNVGASPEVAVRSLVSKRLLHLAGTLKGLHVAIVPTGVIYDRLLGRIPWPEALPYSRYALPAKISRAGTCSHHAVRCHVGASTTEHHLRAQTQKRGTHCCRLPRLFPAGHLSASRPVLRVCSKPLRQP